MPELTLTVALVLSVFPLAASALAVPQDPPVPIPAQEQALDVEAIHARQAELLALEVRDPAMEAELALRLGPTVEQIRLGAEPEGN